MSAAIALPPLYFSQIARAAEGREAGAGEFCKCRHTAPGGGTRPVDPCSKSKTI
jgi:hypothetical protein